MIKHRHSLPREVVESQFLGILKSYLDTSLSNLSRWPCFKQRLDEVDPKGPFQTQPASDAVKWQWWILSGFSTKPLLTQFNFLRNILQAYLTLPQNISLITVLLLYSSAGNQLSFTSKSHIQDEFFQSINTGVNIFLIEAEAETWKSQHGSCRYRNARKYVTPCF